MPDMILAEEALKAAGDYVLGVADQDRDALLDLFAESAHIVGADEGTAISVPRDRWVDAMCAPAKAGLASRNYRMTSISLAGSVGVVIVETVYGRFAYCDVLTLFKHAGKIRITQKAFHQQEIGTGG